MTKIIPEEGTVCTFSMTASYTVCINRTYSHLARETTLYIYVYYNMVYVTTFPLLWHDRSYSTHNFVHNVCNFKEFAVP